MERFELISVVGTVREQLGKALFQVELSNGHKVVSHLEGSLLEKVISNEVLCLPGSKVQLQLRAFDLSTGRILSLQSSEDVVPEQVAVFSSSNAVSTGLAEARCAQQISP